MDNTEYLKEMNRKRQARWRANNLEEARKQGRAKSKRYQQKMKQLRKSESPQMNFDF